MFDGGVGRAEEPSEEIGRNLHRAVHIAHELVMIISDGEIGFGAQAKQSGER